MVIMVAGTLYPPLMADATGRADHHLAMALFWAMSAGFVRGVGFVPQRLVWRLLFSGWACSAALALAGALKLQH
jgi:predicted membrane protein